MDVSLFGGRRPYQLDESPVLTIRGDSRDATLRLLERVLMQQTKNLAPVADTAVTDIPETDDELGRACWEDTEWQ